MVAKIIVPQNTHVLRLRTCDDVTLQGKGSFWDVIVLKTHRWEIILGFPYRKKASYGLEIENLFWGARIRRKRDYGRVVKKCNLCWLWRLQERNTSSGIKATCGKRKGMRMRMDSSLELLEQSTAPPTPDFSQCSDFQHFHLMAHLNELLKCSGTPKIHIFCTSKI